jgi:hypothetical protein
MTTTADFHMDLSENISLGHQIKASVFEVKNAHEAASILNNLTVNHVVNKCSAIQATRIYCCK